MVKFYIKGDCYFYTGFLQVKLSRYYYCVLKALMKLQNKLFQINFEYLLIDYNKHFVVKNQNLLRGFFLKFAISFEKIKQLERWPHDRIHQDFI